LFTNRVREISTTIANHNRYRAIRKTMSNPHHYPAAALAIAAAGVGVAPIAASGHSAPAKPAAVATAHPATPNKPATPAAKPTPAKPAATPAPAKAQAPKPTNPWAGTTTTQLEPTGTDGTQSQIPLDSAQWANATSIVKAAQNLHLSPYAATIAVATSMQESKLQNLNVAVDHDSLGLFQQRPSTGWGAPDQLEDPNYAATAFLKSLPSNYQSMQLDDAAQQVQRSFDGQLYAQWEDQASHIVYSIVNS
jgi:hypothetical protein